MDFKQHVLQHFLTDKFSEKYKLRPTEIQKISRNSILDIITVEVGTEVIDAYEPETKEAYEPLRSNKKEQYSLIVILTKCLAENIENIDLSPKHIHKLLDLSYRQLIQLSNQSESDLIKVSIDEFRLSHVIEFRRKADLKTKEIEKLVRYGASKRFMAEEYNLSPKQFMFLKNAFEIDKVFGRPKNLTEQQSHAVYEIWKKNQHMKIGQAYICIYEELERFYKKPINVRNIATAIEELEIRTA